jgi:hypothetical protein
MRPSMMMLVSSSFGAAGRSLSASSSSATLPAAKVRTSSYFMLIANRMPKNTEKK